MAIIPPFLGPARIGRASPSTANPNTDGTGTITDLLTGVAAGTRVLSINVQGTGTTVAALVNLFTFDGTSWKLYDQITVSATTGSGTAKSYRLVTPYTDLVLPSASWKLGCTLTVLPTSGTVEVSAYGADLT